jgi:hypothetical protein
MAEMPRGNVLLGQFTKGKKLSDPWFVLRKRSLNGHFYGTPSF